MPRRPPTAPAKRGPRGEGSVYFRKDRGRFILAMTLEDASGQPVARTWSFRTRAEANRKRRQLLAERDQGGTLANERQTVAQLLEKYERLVIAGRAHNTRRATRATIKNHLTPAFGETPVVRLRASSIQQYAMTMQRDGYAPQHIRNVLGVLRAALNQAVAWGELQRSPFVGVKVPGGSAAEPTLLSPEQIQRLLTLVRGDRLEALLWLACTTGMRSAELLGLAWTDVHIGRGTVTVRQQAQRGDGIKDIKTGAVGARTIPLAAPTRQALERHRARGTNGPLVFPTRTGRPLSHTSLSEWWRALLARAGLREVDGPTGYKFHGLRHGVGSFLLWLGMDLAQVSRILGHSSVAVTSRIYLHSIASGEHGMLDRLGALLTPLEDHTLADRQTNVDITAPQPSPGAKSPD